MSDLNPYPSYAFLIWEGAEEVPLRTISMLIRVPRTAECTHDPDWAG